MNIDGVEVQEPLTIRIDGPEPRRLVGFACPQCGVAFLVQYRTDQHLRDAEALHQSKEAAQHCIKACACGNPTGRYYRLRCDACSAQREFEKERARFEKSEKLTIEQYDDPVYWEGHSGSMGDGYFRDIEDLLDYCENDGLDIPEYCWACTPQEMKIDATDVLELASHDLYEDASSDVGDPAIDRLQQYLDQWCREVALVGWSQDCSRSIVLRDAGEDAKALAG